MANFGDGNHGSQIIKDYDIYNTEKVLYNELNGIEDDDDDLGHDDIRPLTKYEKIEMKIKKEFEIREAEIDAITGRQLDSSKYDSVLRIKTSHPKLMKQRKIKTADANILKTKNNHYTNIINAGNKKFNNKVLYVNNREIMYDDCMIKGTCITRPHTSFNI